MSSINVNTINEYTGANGVTIDGVKIKDGSITSGNSVPVADIWRLTSDVTGTDGTISSNLERASTTTGHGDVGTAMSVSSGVFTFPQTGVYWVRMNAYMLSASDTYTQIEIEITEDDTNYTLAAVNGDGDAGAGGSALVEIFFEVTDTSTHKVRFQTSSMASGSKIFGYSGKNGTTFSFIRLGDA